MPPKSQSGRPSSGNVPPTSRRSARQQRLATRESNRALSRAGTHGSSGGPSQFALYTAVAVLIAVVVIAGAIFLANQKGSSAAALGSPNPPLPSQVTPSSIPVSGRTLGNANAKVTIDLYEDFQCTACWTFTHDIEPQVVADLVATGKAKLVYHDFLTIDANVGGTESLDAANAALCANDQGKFWQFHDWLFANQYTEGSGAFTKVRIKAIAAAMGGLDLTKFDSCVDAGTHNADVQAEQQNLPSGAQGTPSVVVNGTLLSTYDYATIASAVNGALGISPSPSVSPTQAASPTATSAPSASPSVKPS
jgi:protein-disulfide isomerase